jgi:hypothetical protein
LAGGIFHKIPPVCKRISIIESRYVDAMECEGAVAPWSNRHILLSMPAILEIREMRERVAPLSVETYHRMMNDGSIGNRAELIEGVIIEKMGKSPLHTRLSHRLFEILRTRLGDGFWVRLEAPLSLKAQLSEPEPDLSVVAGSDHDYAVSHPSTALLVVEISVSSIEALIGAWPDFTLRPGSKSIGSFAVGRKSWKSTPVPPRPATLNIGMQDRRAR